MLIRLDEGGVIYNGCDLTDLSNKELRKFRLKMQLIPQNPEEALDPRWKIYDSIAEPLRIHGIVESRHEEMERISELIDVVGLKEELLNKYPHEISGGELQRAVTARTLTLNPEFVVCDEPTSMLDVSTQASIVRLLMDLQRRFGMTHLFITHDIELASVIADRIAIMNSGKIIRELKPRELRSRLKDTCRLYEPMRV